MRAAQRIAVCRAGEPPAAAAARSASLTGLGHPQAHNGRSRRSAGRGARASRARRASQLCQGPGTGFVGQGCCRALRLRGGEGGDTDEGAGGALRGPGAGGACGGESVRAAEEPPLPGGWSKRWDSDGRVYYFDEISLARQLHHPAAAAPAGAVSTAGLDEEADASPAIGYSSTRAPGRRASAIGGVASEESGVGHAAVRERKEGGSSGERESVPQTGRGADMITDRRTGDRAADQESTVDPAGGGGTGGPGDRGGRREGKRAWALTDAPVLAGMPMHTEREASLGASAARVGRLEGHETVCQGAQPDATREEAGWLPALR